MSDRKYASDYRVEQIPTLEGTKTTRVYTGAYYRFCGAGSKRKRDGQRLLSGAGIILILMLPLLFNNTQIGRRAYVLLPMGFTLIPLYQVGMVGYRMLTFPEKLTRQQRDQTEVRLQAAAAWLTALLGATALGMAAYLLGPGPERGEWLPIAGVLAGLVVSLWVMKVRRAVRTEEVG